MSMMYSSGQRKYKFLLLILSQVEVFLEFLWIFKYSVSSSVSLEKVTRRSLTQTDFKLPAQTDRTLGWSENGSEMLDLNFK